MARGGGGADMASGIHFGRIPGNAVHLCVDMQRLFAEDTAWRTPWMPRVLPIVVRLCERKAERTCFTRFIPARSPGDGHGTWRCYWERWASITLDNLGEEGIELLPELQAFTPPARVLDKVHYSPWIDTGLAAALTAGRVDTLVVSGAETDMCVLATVLGAVDLGFRVVVVSDALCSSSDQSRRPAGPLPRPFRPADRDGGVRRGSGGLGLVRFNRRGTRLGTSAGIPLRPQNR